jgi:hypothetical protein
MVIQLFHRAASTQQVNSRRLSFLLLAVRPRSARRKLRIQSAEAGPDLLALEAQFADNQMALSAITGVHTVYSSADLASYSDSHDTALL